MNFKNLINASSLAKIRYWLCVLLIFVPWGYYVIVDKEVWPFSTFPMYSYPMGTEPTAWCKVSIVNHSQVESEIRDTNVLWPFLQPKLSKTLWDFTRDPLGAEKTNELIHHFSRKWRHFNKNYLKSDEIIKLRITKYYGFTEMVGNEVKRIILKKEILKEIEIKHE